MKNYSQIADGIREEEHKFSSFEQNMKGIIHNSLKTVIVTV